MPNQPTLATQVCVRVPNTRDDDVAAAMESRATIGDLAARWNVTHDRAAEWVRNRHPDKYPTLKARTPRASRYRPAGELRVLAKPVAPPQPQERACAYFKPELLRRCGQPSGKALYCPECADRTVIPGSRFSSAGVGMYDGRAR